MSNAVATKETATSITFTKKLQAPKELVFETFSTPKHLKAWWMPKGCTMFCCTADFRAGGEWRYGVTIDDEGSEHWVKAIYEEIVPNERIVFSDNFTDKNGTIIESMPGKRMVISFESDGGNTILTVETQLPTEEKKAELTKMGFVGGMTMALSNLTELLEKL